MTRTCSRYVRTGSRVRRRRRTSWSTNLRRRSDPNRHGETEPRQTPVSGVRIADIVARQQILQWIDRPDVYTSRVRAIRRGLLPRPDCLHRRYRCSRSMSLDVTSTSETVRRSRDGGGVRLSCSHSSTAWHANAPDARVSWSVMPRTATVPHTERPIQRRETGSKSTTFVGSPAASHTADRYPPVAAPRTCAGTRSSAKTSSVTRGGRSVIAAFARSRGAVSY